jgi:hypothetical protein
MPTQTLEKPRINPVRKARVKSNLLKGKDAKNSLLAAGYKDSYANHSTSTACVKVCQEEILNDIKEKITVDYVLAELEKAKLIAITGKKKDISSFVRATELLGRWRAMFTDKTDNVNRDKSIDYTADEDIDRLTMFSRMKVNKQ